MPDHLFREGEIFHRIVVDRFLKHRVDVKQVVVAGKI